MLIPIQLSCYRYFVAPLNKKFSYSFIASSQTYDSRNGTTICNGTSRRYNYAVGPPSKDQRKRRFQRIAADLTTECCCWYIIIMGKVKAALGGVAAYQVAKKTREYKEKKHISEKASADSRKKHHGSSKTKVVLSCDGGGVKGLATAQFLYRLEQETGKPLHDLFDLYAGTSVGAIIVSSIACKQASMQEALDLYNRDTLKLIFHSSLKDKLLDLAQPDPKYDSKGMLSIFTSNESLTSWHRKNQIPWFVFRRFSPTRL